MRPAGSTPITGINALGGQIFYYYDVPQYAEMIENSHASYMEFFYSVIGYVSLVG